MRKNRFNGDVNNTENNEEIKENLANNRNQINNNRGIISLKFK